MIPSESVCQTESNNKFIMFVTSDLSELMAQKTSTKFNAMGFNLLQLSP